MCAIIGFDSPTLTEQEIRPYFDRTVSRGPDMSRMEKAGHGMLGFHRLAIMGLHEEGMQPFHLQNFQSSRHNIFPSPTAFFCVSVKTSVCSQSSLP